MMKEYKLDLVPGGVSEPINVSQYDVNRKWRFNLVYADDVYTIPPGATIRIDGTKPDNKGFSYNQSDGVITTGDDYVVVTSTSQMTPVAGDVMCELRIQQGDQDIGTANFILRVERAAVAVDADMSETDIPAIVDAATQQMIAAARSAEAALASEQAAKASEEAAAASETAAAASADESDTSAGIAKSWATYPTDPAARGSATNNAQYWSDQAKVTQIQVQSSMTTAEAAASAAKASELAAQSSKTMAEAARDKAKDWADTAESWADHAQSSMTTAEAARDKAKDWADTAESWAEHAQSSKTTAWEAANTAKNWAETSEGWADHAQSSMTMAEAARDHAQSSMTMAEASKVAAKASEEAAADEADRAKSWASYEDDPDDWGSDTNNSHYWADHAQSSYTMADEARELARIWAQGPSGTGTPSDTNNAEYWAHEAQSAAGGGVTSWNGRTGGVLPQAGDYSASQISYDGGFVDQKKADVNSPTLTGEPRSTTPPDGDNSTRIATTEFVYRAGGGSVITVSTAETTLFGKDVTITDGIETMTETFNDQGKAIFRGVRLTGDLTVSATDGTDTAVKTLTVLYYGSYAVTLVFEYSTIHITTTDPLLIGQTAYVYSGQTQVGSVVLSGGSGDVIVHQIGTFTVRASARNIQTESAVTVSQYFETYNVTLALSYATLNISTAETTLRNQAISVKSNGSVIATGTFDSSGTATIYVGTFGTLTVESTDGTETATSTVTAQTGQSYNVVLAFEYATIEVTTTDPLLAGKTVTAALGTESYSGSFVNGKASIVVKELGTYTISATSEGITGSTTAQVTAFFTTVSATLNLSYATLNIAAGETSLYGKDATITWTGGSKTVTLDSTGHATAYVGYAGSVTVSASDGTETASTTITVAYGTSYNVSLLFSYATIHVTTTDPLLDGATVTATLSGTSYTGTIASGACDIIVKNTGSYTVSASAGGFTKSETVNVAAYFNVYNVTLILPYATLNVTTSETSLYGKAISVKNSGGTEIATGTFSASGSAQVRVGTLGTLTVTSTNGTDTATSTVTTAAYQTTYNVDLSFLKIVTWANGTDAEVAAMIEADRAGKIDLYDYWATGDTRNVQISAMAATGVGESHVAQTVQLVLVAKNVVDLASGGKCKFVWQLKDGLANGTSGEFGYMNSTNTNVGGWKDSARRTWCNSVFYNALPAWLRGVMKDASIKTSKGNQLTTFDTTTDKCFLPCEYNIFGTTTYSVAGEDNVHWEWYQTAANRIKKQGSGGSAYRWWERSPDGSNAAYFCNVSASGAANNANARNTALLAPCGCI